MGTFSQFYLAAYKGPIVSWVEGGSFLMFLIYLVQHRNTNNDHNQAPYLPGSVFAFSGLMTGCRCVLCMNAAGPDSAQTQIRPCCTCASHPIQL